VFTECLAVVRCDDNKRVVEQPLVEKYLEKFADTPISLTDFRVVKVRRNPHVGLVKACTVGHQSGEHLTIIGVAKVFVDALSAPAKLPALRIVRMVWIHQDRKPKDRSSCFHKPAAQQLQSLGRPAQLRPTKVSRLEMVRQSISESLSNAIYQATILARHP
jgi:hypothetical protein